MVREGPPPGDSSPAFLSLLPCSSVLSGCLSPVLGRGTPRSGGMVLPFCCLPLPVTGRSGPGVHPERPCSERGSLPLRGKVNTPGPGTQVKMRFPSACPGIPGTPAPPGGAALTRGPAFPMETAGQGHAPVVCLADAQPGPQSPPPPLVPQFHRFPLKVPLAGQHTPELLLSCGLHSR